MILFGSPFVSCLLIAFYFGMGNVYTQTPLCLGYTYNQPLSVKLMVMGDENGNPATVHGNLEGTYGSLSPYTNYSAGFSR